MAKIDGYKGLLIQVESHIHAHFRQEAKRQKMSMQDLGELLIETYLEVTESDRRKSRVVLRKNNKGA